MRSVAAVSVLLSLLVVTGDASAEAAKRNNPQNPIADKVYLNGSIYTVDKLRPWAEAVAISGGRFIRVGSNSEVKDLVGPGTEVVDLNGAFAMPGLVDPHVHPSLLMPRRAYCALPGTFHEPTETETLAALRQCIAEYPADRPWFIAQGFSTPAMAPETLTLAVLDRLVPDRPAWVEDESGHNAWFNTRAMELAGVNRDFQDSPEGFFSRTSQGDLAGVAYEGAMNPFLEAMPPLDLELKKYAYTKFLRRASEQGVTALGDAYVQEGDLVAWQALKRDRALNQHVNLYLEGNFGSAELTPVADLVSMWERYDLPGRRGVKLAMGGAIESASEPLVDGYLDPSHNPPPLIPVPEFSAYLGALDQAGFQAKVHAIGDGTVRATLDGFEPVITARGGNELRHHIDHCSLVHPDDFSRFVKLDVTCTIWPMLNAPIDYNMLGVKPMLKPETWARIYPNKDMRDAGMRLVQHSDAPAAELWLWWGMEAAITRGFPGRPERGVLNPDQSLALHDVIEAHTINGAWVMGLDKETGSIEEGKWADMIVLNHNLFQIPPNRIHTTTVDLVLFKGRVVGDD